MIFFKFSNIFPPDKEIITQYFPFEKEISPTTPISEQNYLPILPNSQIKNIDSNNDIELFFNNFY
jgi:hypothetical protein